jgi:hypothetical protein
VRSAAPINCAQSAGRSCSRIFWKDAGLNIVQRPDPSRKTMSWRRKTMRNQIEEGSFARSYARGNLCPSGSIGTSSQHRKPTGLRPKRGSGGSQGRCPGSFRQSLVRLARSHSGGQIQGGQGRGCGTVCVHGSAGSRPRRESGRGLKGRIPRVLVVPPCRAWWPKGFRAKRSKNWRAVLNRSGITIQRLHLSGRSRRKDTNLTLSQFGSN